MKWSWRIGRLGGIDIRMHATFPLLFAWIALSAAHEGLTLGALLGSFALIIAVFILVVLHECSHALTARHYGIRTRDITLLPIGGIARLERMPREPRQELLITLAGPAVNVVLAIILAGVLAASGNLSRLGELVQTNSVRLTWAGALAQLFVVNVSLAVFNMLPAFPIDGGRALRAVLAMRSGNYAKATATAARVGRVFALAFGLLGFFVLNNPVLVVIALFIWLSAAAEASAVQTSTALEGLPLASLLVTDVRTVAPNESLGRVAELTVQGFQQDFPVVENGLVVGMLTLGDLVRGLARHGNQGTVASAMKPDFAMATPDVTPEDALKTLSMSGAATLPVLRGRQLVGLLTAENVVEFLKLRTASAH